MEKNWKRLERLVAAIHHALNDVAAAIHWGELIDGRQFDLTIRFSSLGYTYLTTVECKDYKVPVKEVEAFATKSRRAGANKAVMVSSVGFQSGAIQVAREERIDLYVLGEVEAWPSGVKVVSSGPALAIENVRLLDQASTVRHEFPNESSALQYFAGETRLTPVGGGQTRTVDEVIMGARPVWDTGITEEEKQIEISLGDVCDVNVPFIDGFQAATLRFSVRLATMLELDTGGIDPAMLPTQFFFRNVLTNEEQRVGEGRIWLGFDTEIQAGKFYWDPLHAHRYYCEKRDGNKITIVLVESYQHGNLFRCRYRQTLLGRSRVLEVTDEAERGRLARMYEDFCSGETRAGVG